MAVLIPGHNEALLIAQVVKDFKIALPSAKIYVYDNCSSDDTTAVAIAAGAMVRAEPWPGKGNVVRRMFADIDADVFVVADGSGTYDPTSAPLMVIKIISDELDMVLGTRRGVYENAHHTGHGFVNKLFNGIYRSLFGPLFYGYFSRLSGVFAPARKELPWSIQRLRNPNGDVGPRKSAAHADCRDSDCIWRAPRGAVSKLRLFHDAFRILGTIVQIFKEIQPACFYAAIAFVLIVFAIILGYPLFEKYM